MNRRSFFASAVAALASVPGLGWLKPKTVAISGYAYPFGTRLENYSSLYTTITRKQLVELMRKAHERLEKQKAAELAANSWGNDYREDCDTGESESGCHFPMT